MWLTYNILITIIGFITVSPLLRQSTRLQKLLAVDIIAFIAFLWFALVFNL